MPLLLHDNHRLTYALFSLRCHFPAEIDLIMNLSAVHLWRAVHELARAVREMIPLRTERQ